MEILFIAAALGLIPAYIANNKGGGFFTWWFFGTMLWIIALPCAILMKSDPSAIAEKEGLFKCPECAEFIKREAKICRFCGYKFTYEDKVNSPTKTIKSYTSIRDEAINELEGLIKCPACAKLINKEWTKCEFCGYKRIRRKK